MINRKESARLRSSRDFRGLVRIMDILLSPGGCPWDARQTHSTLIKYLREEAGEVARAVRKKDWDNLREELGDVLLQVVFHAALAKKAGRFGIGDVVRGINSKLVRRHPHVFGGGKKEKLTPAEVLRRWDRIKAREKAARRK